jgi:hypothetical protein
LVAILAVVLIGISGFTIDLGQAYVSKRNLQKAADAGALAAAQALTEFQGSCAGVRDDPVAHAAAQDAARKYGEANYDETKTSYESNQLEFDIDCDRTPGVLIVEYGLSGTTPTSTSQLIGAPDDITTDRRSEATVDVAPRAREGVRPLALCSAMLPPIDSAAGTFIRVDYPGGGHAPPAGCPVPKTSGNWWITDCPGERTGSASTLADQIKDGCPDPVSVVPGQADASTPGQLTVVLEEECPFAPLYSETCMSGNPGNISQGGKQTADAWKSLITSEEASLFPVFCAPPQCSASTIDGTGAGAVYPVYKLVSAVVCGYYFKSGSGNSFQSKVDKCEGNPYFGKTTDTDSKANYLVMRYENVRSSGSNTESECGLGDDCDGGLRRTRLTGGGS